MKNIESTDEKLLAISPEDLDQLVKEIRAGAIVGLLMLAMIIFRLIRGEYIVLFHSVEIGKAFIVIELLLTGTCAILIYRLSVNAAMCLFAILLITTPIWYLRGSHWGLFPSVIFALVILRTIKQLFRFKDIHDAAIRKKMYISSNSETRA